MKKLLTLALAVSTLWAAPTLLSAAEQQAAGKYSGSWANTEGDSDKIDIALTLSVENSWTGDIQLWAEGDRLPVTMESVAIEGTQVAIVYDFRAEGATFTVKMKGTVTDQGMAGKFEVLNRRGKVTSSGTWKSKRSE